MTNYMRIQVALPSAAPLKALITSAKRNLPPVQAIRHTTLPATWDLPTVVFPLRSNPAEPHRSTTTTHFNLLSEAMTCGSLLIQLGGLLVLPPIAPQLVQLSHLSSANVPNLLDD